MDTWDVLSQVQAAALPGFRFSAFEGLPLRMVDALGRAFPVVRDPVQEHEWLVFERDVPPALPETEGASTTTTTEMVPHNPPTLLGQLQGVEQVALPHDLQGIRLCPNSLREPASALLPAAQLRLSPELDPAAQPKTVVFTVMAHGAEPLRAQGRSTWSLVDFAWEAARHAESGLQQVHLLLTGVPGLPSPQLVITEGEAAADHAVVPIDFRGMGRGVLPILLRPGMSAAEISEAASAIVPGLAQVLTDPLLQDRLYYQDAQGHIYDALPPCLTTLQWLILRLQPSALSAQLDAPFTSTTTSTTAAVTAHEQTLSFVLVGDAATLRLPIEPVRTADPQTALLELITGLTRIEATFHVRLPPVLPRTSQHSHYVVPLLLIPPTEDVVVFYDPGIDGSQIHAVHVDAGTWGDDLLTDRQRARGIQLYINGAHLNVCRRPLQTGDFVQQFGPGSFRGTARNALPLMYSVNRLRCLSFPFAIPPIRFFHTAAGLELALAPGHPSLREHLEELFEERVERLGRPARESKLIVVLQHSYAPHIFWLPTPLTPDVHEACALLQATGFFGPEHTLVETESEVEARAEIFLNVLTEASYVTCTVRDPFDVCQFLLVHPPPDGVFQAELLPARPGFEFTAWPQPLANGIHLHSRRGPLPAVAAPTASLGVSLLQRSAGLRKATIKPDQQPLGSASVQIPTPFGRRRIRPEAPSQTRQTVCLDALLPPAPPVEHRLKFAVNRDIRDHILEPFAVGNLHQDVRAELHPAAAKLLNSLRPLPAGVTGSQAMLFVDGSFDSASGQGTWAVATVVDSQAVWHWGGFASGCLHGRQGDNTSAYQAELYAQLAAHLIVMASQWDRSCIFYDATAAAQVTASEAAAQDWGLCNRPPPRHASVCSSRKESQRSSTSKAIQAIRATSWLTRLQPGLTVMGHDLSICKITCSKQLTKRRLIGSGCPKPEPPTQPGPPSWIQASLCPVFWLRLPLLCAVPLIGLFQPNTSASLPTVFSCACVPITRFLPSRVCRNAACMRL